MRQDGLCGSTIGPIVSAHLAIRTVGACVESSAGVVTAADIGAPQLSMHSIREMMGVADVEHVVRLLTAFYHHVPAADAALVVDGQ